jgi:hypothetical protein
MRTWLQTSVKRSACGNKSASAANTFSPPRAVTSQWWTRAVFKV